MPNNKYQPGEENLPPRHIVSRSIPILVLVYNLRDNDSVAIEKRIDYSSMEDRKWLGRITHWAVTNHHSVETMAIVDAEVPTK